MSLIMSFETYEGIIMTADRMATVSVFNEFHNTTDSFCKTQNAKKLFVLNNRYGLSFCGQGKFSDNVLMEYYLQTYKCYENTPVDLANKLLEDISRKEKLNTTLLLCGYHNHESFTIEINIAKNEIYIYPDSSKNKVVRYGDTSIVNALFNDKFYYGLCDYRLSDGIDLLKYTNEVSAKYQKFQETLQTISEECDILLLTPDGGYKWLIKNEINI